MTKRVCMVLDDGFEELEAVGTFDMLKRAGVEVDVLALCNRDTRGKHNLLWADLKPIKLLSNGEIAYDALILPGGPHYQALEKSAVIRQKINEFLGKGKVVAAICASPTILGRMGLLKGKNYTCFTAMNEDFGGYFKDQYAVIDGNIITGQSAAAAVDFGLAIAEKLCGKEQAEEVKKSIYYK